MNFADDIRKIRIQCLMSQEMFAKELGVSFATVNRWESGKTKPSFKTMKLIADFCEKAKIDYDITEKVLGGQHE